MPRSLLFPPDLKVLGCNLSCSPAVGQGTTNPYILMHLAWDTEWLHIKKQIDYLVGNSVGAHCFRLFGAGWGILGGLISQAKVDANLLQVAQYLKSLGCYFYFNWATQYDAPSAAYSTAAVAQSVASSLLPIQRLSNCIGCDVAQEAAENIWTVPYLQGCMADVRALVPGMPVTVSQQTQSSWTPVSDWLNAIGDSCDYIDIHNYANPSDDTFFDAVRARFPNHDLLIGELGGNASETPDVIANRFNRTLRMATSADPRMRGVLMWCGADDHDTPASAAYGLYTSAFVPRQDRINWLRRYTGGSLAKSLARR